MTARLDITGQKFNRLLVISDAGKSDKHGKSVWLCRCDCGNEVEVVGSLLTKGNTKSCGCLKSEAARRNGKSGSDSPNWKGGKFKNKAGYIREQVASAHYRPEHDLIMEKHIGRPLKYLGMTHPDNEIVHHINWIKDDNRLENLCLMTVAEHNRLHGYKVGRSKKEHAMWIKGITKEHIERLISEGFQQREIADYFGVSVDTIMLRRKMYGIGGDLRSCPNAFRPRRMVPRPRQLAEMQGVDH